MDKIFAQHGDFDHLHLEARCVGDRWEWRVFDKKTSIQIAQGRAESLVRAKAAAEVAAGCKPEWRAGAKDLEKHA